MTALLVVAIVALAVLVRSVWGFGDGMLALPLLAAVIGFDQAAPMMAMLSAVIAIWLLRERPELVETNTILRLLMGAVVGVPVGLYVLLGLPTQWAHLVLGSLLTTFASWSLAGRWVARNGATPASLERPADAAPRKRVGLLVDLGFGVLAGATSTAFDIAGPPMLVYAAVRRWSPDTLRVNLQAMFLPLAVLTLGGHGMAGLWNLEILQLAGYSLPVVILGLWLGPRLREWLGQLGGDWIVYLLILLLGFSELVRGVGWL